MHFLKKIELEQEKKKLEVLKETLRLTGIEIEKLNLNADIKELDDIIKGTNETNKNTVISKETYVQTKINNRSKNQKPQSNQ
jgi:hypothetical protein